MVLNVAIPSYTSSSSSDLHGGRDTIIDNDDAARPGRRPTTTKIARPPSTPGAPPLTLSWKRHSPSWTPAIPLRRTRTQSPHQGPSYDRGRRVWGIHLCPLQLHLHGATPHAIRRLNFSFIENKSGVSSYLDILLLLWLMYSF